MASDNSNIIKELLIRSGRSQKELADAMGVSQPTVHAWVTYGKPKAERLEAIAKFFNVDKSVLTGEKEENQTQAPVTPEARILAKGFDKMPEEARKRALEMAKLMFSEYAEYFEKGADDDEA